MASEKCSVCNGEPGDGYHKDPEEVCSACNGTGESSKSTSSKAKKKE